MNSFLSATHRPLVVTTEEYGKLWLSLSHDVKQNLKLLTDADDPLRTTLNALKDALQLHVVDIIGKQLPSYSHFTTFHIAPSFTHSLAVIPVIPWAFFQARRE